MSNFFKKHSSSLMALFVLVMAMLITCCYAPEALAAELGGITLISEDVIEIEYNEPVTSNEQAQGIFTIEFDGEEVEWEFLSYF
ncbi:MAG: hypothetical protein Q4B50_08840, partial [Bacillota bacterium]|nr:hypothetical protein [Bacillota bacterium]